MPQQNSNSTRRARMLGNLVRVDAVCGQPRFRAEDRVGNEPGVISPHAEIFESARCRALTESSGREIGLMRCATAQTDGGVVTK